MKDTLITGSLRVTDTIFGTNLNLTSLTASQAILTDANKNLVSRDITNNTSAAAVTASTNLITANTLYYHKGNSNIVTVGTITSGTWQGTAIGTAYGGTGNNSFTQWGIIYANPATKLVSTSAGTSGYLLQGNGSAAPSWIQATNSNTGNTIVKRDASGNFSAGIITSMGGIEIKGHIAGDGNATGHGLYSGGGYHNAYNNIILHGDVSTGSSGIAFVSDKAAADGTITNVNQPSDRAFIQYHACGVTTATAENNDPVLATTNELGRFVIGVGNDAYSSSSTVYDELWLQTNSHLDLIHQIGANSYVIPDTNNHTGSVGGSTTPVYVEGGIIKTCTAYSSASVNYAASAGSVAWANVSGHPTIDKTTTIYQISRGSSFDPIQSGYFAGMTQSSGITTDWWHILSMDWSGNDANNWISQLALPTQNRTGVYYRSRHSSTTNDWKKLWTSGESITNAVWNDYAECRMADTQEPGRVLMEVGDDTLTSTKERMSHFAGVSSDTWGFLQGETETAKTPLAVAGRTLVYPYRNRNEYKPGDCVCAAPNGTVDIMTREEIIRYPDRIVGTVSCIPTYEEWGGSDKNIEDRPPIKVNGRIWIKIK